MNALVLAGAMLFVLVVYVRWAWRGWLPTNWGKGTEPFTVERIAEAFDVPPHLIDHTIEPPPVPDWDWPDPRDYGLGD